MEATSSSSTHVLPTTFPDYFMDTVNVDDIRKVIVMGEDNRGLRLAAKTQKYEFPEETGLPKKVKCSAATAPRDSIVIVFDKDDTKVVFRECSLPGVPPSNFVLSAVVLRKCLIYRPKQSLIKAAKSSKGRGGGAGDEVKTVYLPYVEMAAIDILCLEGSKPVVDVILSFLLLNEVFDGYKQYVGEDVQMPSDLCQSDLVKEEIGHEVSTVKQRSATYLSTKRGTGEAFDLCGILERSRLQEVEATFLHDNNYIPTVKVLDSYMIYFNVRDRVFDLPGEWLALIRVDKRTLYTKTKSVVDRLNNQVSILLSGGRVGDTITLRSCLESVYENDKDFFLKVAEFKDIRHDGHKYTGLFQAAGDLNTLYGQLSRVYRVCAVLRELLHDNALGPLTTDVTGLLTEGGLWSCLPASDIDPHTSTPDSVGALASSAAMKALHTLLTKKPVTISSLPDIFLSDASVKKTSSTLKYHYLEGAFTLIGYNDRKLLHSYTLVTNEDGKGSVENTTPSFHEINNVIRQTLDVRSFATLEELFKKVSHDGDATQREVLNMVFRIIVSKSNLDNKDTAKFYFKAWFDPRRDFLKTVTDTSFDVQNVVYKPQDAAFVENALGKSIGRVFKERFSVDTWMMGLTTPYVTLATNDLMGATFKKTGPISTHELAQNEILTESDATNFLTNVNAKGLLSDKNVAKLEVNVSKDIYYMNGEPVMYVVHRHVPVQPDYTGQNRVDVVVAARKTMLRDMIRRFFVASKKLNLKIGFNTLFPSSTTSRRSTKDAGGEKLKKGPSDTSTVAVVDPRCVMYDNRTSVEKGSPLSYLDTTYVTATGQPASLVIGGSEIIHMTSDDRNLARAMDEYENSPVKAEDVDVTMAVLRDLYRSMAHSSPDNDGTWQTGPMADSLLLYAGPYVDNILQSRSVVSQTTARPDSLLDYISTWT